MALEPGTRLGRYEILAPIGARTAVEAYKAADTEGNRHVAIEVIPPDWAGAAEFVQRRQLFDRTTHTLAALNDPRIRAVIEVGQENGVSFVVVEYVEGQTLAERIKGKPLGVREAIEITMAIADALDAAHGAGVAHRDLNPANVLLTKEGVKLLDFGWAELGPAPASAAIPRTVTGIQAARKPEESLTLHYTAPELLEGKPADGRSDLFALGAIFYEMLTGKKAFDGRSRGVLIAALTTADPEPLSQAAPHVPRVLDHIIQRCVEKDPEDRYQTARTLLLELQWITEGDTAGGLGAPAGRSRLLVRAALGAAALLITGLAYPAARYLRGAGEVEALQFRIPVAGLSSSDIAMSPDGQAVAMSVRPNLQEPPALYIRRMSSIAFLRLAGTEDGMQPFWSPDSRYVAFVSGSRLKSVAVAGGAPKDIAEAPSFFGGAWNREGTILFGTAQGLLRVSAEGGQPTPVSTAAAPESGHFWPSFLPDGRHFLFLAWSMQPANRAVFVGSLDGKERSKLMAAESNAVYAAPGFVLFHRNASLFAQPFDASRRALAGEPFHVTGDVATSPTGGRGHFDVSQNGGLVYFQGANAPAGRGRTTSTQFGWVDRNGNRSVTAGDGGIYGDVDISPDGKLIAVTKQEPGTPGSDIWVIDWERGGTATRLTLDPADDVDPIWSPDGTRVAFTTFRKGNADIYVKNANNVGAETPILATSADEIVKDWSKDGRYMAFLSGQDNLMDIYALPLAGNDKTGAGKPFPVVQGHFQKNEPQFSYDVKWLAYTSDETGRFEVTVQSFPQGDQKLQVSTSGGGQPRWRKDGKELYFRGRDGNIMVVDIKTSPKLEAGVPRILFRPPSIAPIALDPVRHQLGVTPDGQRFLLRFGSSGIAPAANGSNIAIPEAQPFAGSRSETSPGLGTRAGTNNGAGGATITTGLTVMQHWTSALEKGEK